MKNNINNYIFDLDGTIINSCNEVMSCFKQAFELSDYPINESKLTSELIGPPLAEIVQNIAPELKDEKTFNKVIDNFRKVYDSHKEDCSVLYSGVREKLYDLKNRGKTLFLATLKPQKPTLRILKDYNIDIFEDVYTIDKYSFLISKGQMLKEIIDIYSLNKDETIMIGDSAGDMVAAREAGINGVGVLWGYGTDKTELKQFATSVINHIDELENISFS